MLRRVYRRSLRATVSSLGLLCLCLIGLGSVWAQGGGQPATVAPVGALSPPASPEPRAMRRTASEDDKSYRIGPGDLLEIKVVNLPEMTREARVDSQGRINLAYIQDIQAACLTENQLRQMIVEKYKKYLRDPQVSVFIREYNSKPVAVIGAVRNPAQYQLQRRVTLLELLARVGGTNEKAGRTIFLVHSGERDLCQAADTSAPDAEPVPNLKTFDLHDVQMGKPEAYLYVEPGDIISVPEADQIFVTGSVIKPGSFPLQNRLTLSEAISMAGGLAQDAQKKKVRLSRQEKTGRKEAFYSYDDIKNHRVEDVALQANDIVDVPSSTGSSTKRGILAALAQSAGLLPMYTILKF